MSNAFKLSTYLIIASFVFISVGCKTLDQKETNISSASLAISSERFFHLTGDVASAKDLQEFLAKYKDGKCLEQDKINYLLKEMKESNLTFVRNGESYSSDKAAKWLRWKMHHPQFDSDPIDSAQEFVTRVAYRSENSGLPYQMILPNGHYVKAMDVLAFELKTLEDGLSKRTMTEFAH